MRMEVEEAEDLLSRVKPGQVTVGILPYYAESLCLLIDTVNIPLRTIYLGIMYMDELYQMIIFALKHYDNWKDRTHLRKVDLAPSKNISSLSYTKSMGLSLSPPQLLLPSSLIPPALSSRCSCPQPLQPSQKGKGLPFHCTN